MIRSIGYAIGVLSSVVLIIYGWNVFSGAPKPGNIPALKIMGSLGGKPRINRHGTNSDIRFTLNEYPAYSFYINSTAYPVAKTEWIENYLDAGNVVELMVSADDYNNSIGQPKTPEGKLQAAIYDLRDKEHVFLSLADYCKKAGSNTWLGIACLIMGSGIALVVCVGIVRGRKRLAIATMS